MAHYFLLRTPKILCFSFLRTPCLPRPLLKEMCILMSFLGLIAWNGTTLSQAAEPTVVTAPATLSILTGTVKYVPAGSTESHIARDGMNVGIGDRILTSAEATALVTFLDGSTLTVQPDSDVEIKKLI